MPGDEISGQKPVEEEKYAKWTEKETPEQALLDELRKPRLDIVALIFAFRRFRRKVDKIAYDNAYTAGEDELLGLMHFCLKRGSLKDDDHKKLKQFAEIIGAAKLPIFEFGQSLASIAATAAIILPENLQKEVEKAVSSPTSDNPLLLRWLFMGVTLVEDIMLHMGNSSSPLIKLALPDIHDLLLEAIFLQLKSDKSLEEITNGVLGKLVKKAGELKEQFLKETNEILTKRQKLEKENSEESREEITELPKKITNKEQEFSIQLESLKQQLALRSVLNEEELRQLNSGKSKAEIATGPLPKINDTLEKYLNDVENNKDNPTEIQKITETFKNEAARLIEQLDCPSSNKKKIMICLGAAIGAVVGAAVGFFTGAGIGAVPGAVLGAGIGVSLAGIGAKFFNSDSQKNKINLMKNTIEEIIKTNINLFVNSETITIDKVKTQVADLKDGLQQIIESHDGVFPAVPWPQSLRAEVENLITECTTVENLFVKAAAIEPKLLKNVFELFKKVAEQVPELNISDALIYRYALLMKWKIMPVTTDTDFQKKLQTLKAEIENIEENAELLALFSYFEEIHLLPSEQEKIIAVLDRVNSAEAIYLNELCEDFQNIKTRVVRRIKEEEVGQQEAEEKQNFIQLLEKTTNPAIALLETCKSSNSLIELILAIEQFNADCVELLLASTGEKIISEDQTVPLSQFCFKKAIETHHVTVDDMIKIYHKLGNIYGHSGKRDYVANIFSRLEAAVSLILPESAKENISGIRDTVLEENDEWDQFFKLAAHLDRIADSCNPPLFEVYKLLRKQAFSQLQKGVSAQEIIDGPIGESVKKAGELKEQFANETQEISNQIQEMEKESGIKGQQEIAELQTQPQDSKDQEFSTKIERIKKLLATHEELVALWGIWQKKEVRQQKDGKSKEEIVAAGPLPKIGVTSFMPLTISFIEARQKLRDSLKQQEKNDANSNNPLLAIAEKILKEIGELSLKVTNPAKDLPLLTTILEQVLEGITPSSLNPNEFDKLVKEINIITDKATKTKWEKLGIGLLIFSAVAVIAVATLITLSLVVAVPAAIPLFTALIGPFLAKIGTAAGAFIAAHIAVGVGTAVATSVSPLVVGGIFYKKGKNSRKTLVGLMDRFPEQSQYNLLVKKMEGTQKTAAQASKKTFDTVKASLVLPTTR
jgi:outer membrane lipoprotein SlyB